MQQIMEKQTKMNQSGLFSFARVKSVAFSATVVMLDVNNGSSVPASPG